MDGAAVGAGVGERVEELAGIVDHEVAVEKEVGCGRNDFTTGGPIVRLGT